MGIRRVVTRSAPDGSSVVAVDDVVEPVTVAALPGYAWHKLWAYDDTLAGSDDPALQAGLAHFPPPGGVRFNLYTVPPATTARPPFTDALRQDMERKLPGRARYLGSDQAGRHRTASVDLIVVLSGRISLDLDNAVSVDLVAGDTVIQNNAAHAWRNDSDAPCTCAIVIVGLTPGS